MNLSYSKYLKLDELLGIQVPLSEKEHDETLFIIIHQVYELWFKQILHELNFLRVSLEKNEPSQAMATLKRTLTILKTMVAQIDILETMTPLSFLAFRDRLENASGFQSIQFRKLEIALGKRSLDEQRQKGLEQDLNKPSIYDSLLKFLKLNGYEIPQKILDHDLTKTHNESPEVQKILIDVYRNNAALMPICERFVDLDEGIQEWRYRHVKMVERTIGTKSGSGGSSGAEYLKRTLFKPLFPDLWIIRSEF